LYVAYELYLVVLGIVMVSVLSLDPRFAGSNPAVGDGILGAITICSTPSFGGEVKPSAPCREILRHVKELFEVWTKIIRNSFPSPVPPALLLDHSVGKIYRELWWANQEFYRVDIIPQSFSMLMSLGR
jgi:hypothetical protein